MSVCRPAYLVGMAGAATDQRLWMTVNSSVRLRSERACVIQFSISLSRSRLNREPSP